MNRAVVLLSDGLDSATTLAVAHEDGFACHALSFAYGQRHDAELDTELGAATRCEVLFSPAWQRQDAAELADWILADHLPVPVPAPLPSLLQSQLHKLPWGDVPGR